VTTMHALFRGKVECKRKGRIFFFARFWFESDDRGRLDAREQLGYRQRIVEILAPAAYPPQRSSNANCLCSAVLAAAAQIYRLNCEGF
jgi:hypothetical protein